MVKKIALFLLVLTYGFSAFAVESTLVPGPLAYIANLKTKNPILAKQAFHNLLIKLAKNPSPANNKLLNQLADQNPDLIAMDADSIEPAAGPAISAPSFAGTPPLNIPLENPNQISANQP